MKLIGRRSFLGSDTRSNATRRAGARPRCLPNSPKVPGTLSLRARRRSKDGRASEQVLQWPVARTAIIICDMWDTHTCAMSAQRVGSDGAADESGGQRRAQSRAS